MSVSSLATLRSEPQPDPLTWAGLTSEYLVGHCHPSDLRWGFSGLGPAPPRAAGPGPSLDPVPSSELPGLPACRTMEWFEVEGAVKGRLVQPPP